MGDLRKIKHNSLTITDGVVFPRDGLRDTEDHRTGQLEQKHLASGLIQQGLLLLAELDVVVRRADRLHLLGLQGTHPINGEHVGHEHPDADRCDQIHQNGEHNHAVGDHSRLGGKVMRPLQKFPVNDVDADLQSDAGQHRQRDHRGQGGCQQHHEHQHNGSDHTGECRAATGLNIDHGAHRGSRTRQSTEQTGRDVGQALADQFLVGIVFGAGEAVGHHRREQSIDAAEHPQHGGIHHHHPDLTTGEVRHAERGELGGERRNRPQTCPAEH